MTIRRQQSPGLKAEVTVEAMRGERMPSRLASQKRVHPVQAGLWRRTALG